MNPTKEKLLERGVPGYLLEIAGRYFADGATYCVIQYYSTPKSFEDSTKVWDWRILHPEDSDIDEYEDPIMRLFEDDKFIRINAK